MALTSCSARAWSFAGASGIVGPMVLEMETEATGGRWNHTFCDTRKLSPADRLKLAELVTAAWDASSVVAASGPHNLSSLTAGERAEYDALRAGC